MSTPLPEFDRMVERFATEAVRVRSRRRVRAVVALIAAALLTTGATLAATGTVRIGAPATVERPPPGVHSFFGAIQGGTHLGTARAADPDGGPPWGVRTFRTTEGYLCAQVGRVVDRKVGLIGFDGAFHELPPRANLACNYDPARARPRGVALDSAGRPTAAMISADSVFAPASTVRLDVNGMSRRVGCDERFRRSLHGSVSPCDLARFRYVAWGVLRSGVRSLEALRVPGGDRATRRAPAADRSFVFVLHGGARRGARVRAVMTSGAVLPLVRAGRQFAVPTGHLAPRLEPVASARVTPGAGGPVTTFALRWRVPLGARHRGDGWTYRLFGPGGSGCNVRLAAVIGEAAGGVVPKRRAREGNEPGPPTRMLPQNGVRLGTRVVRRFRAPGPPPRRWCRGTYRGQIRFRDKTIVGRFAFRVR